MKKIISTTDNNMITRTLPTEISINKLVYRLYNIRKNFIETGKIEEDEEYEIADLIEKIKKKNVFKTLEELESELTMLDTLNHDEREEYFYS
jgi:hypothetical protein